MRHINIGYLRPNKEGFMSNIIFTNNFLDILSHYAKVAVINTDLKNFDDFRKLEKLNIDYLLIDIKNFGAAQFILRERIEVNIPFIIIIHTVYAWLEPLVQIIPLIRKEDIIIAPSQYARKSLLRISDKLKIHVIPHCLDIKSIQDNIAGSFKKRNPKIINYMGRLVKDKGIETLIDCMPEIMTRVDKIHLNIIGPLSGGNITDSPKSSFVKKLQRKVAKNGLADNIHFMGLKLGLEKYKISSEADVFVLPTTIKEENSNISTFEALACGLPVVATKWAGNKEVIREGENGYLIDIEYNRKREPRVNRGQLISLIVKVLKNKKLNLKLKQNAMKTARKFDYRQIMPKLIKLLRKKRKIKFKSRWKLIRDKRVTDFSRLFNKDFWFFLYYSYIFRIETYASLYRQISKSNSLKSRYRANRRVIRRIKARNTKELKLTDKIRRNFSDFLLLKSFS
jgi:glycosyltransferase involved in cell wall biosynthesis